MITTDISIYDKNSISATFFRTTSAIDVKDVYTSFILTVADNNFNLMKKRRPTKERPVIGLRVSTLQDWKRDDSSVARKNLNSGSKIVEPIT
jgi:hypothetical protein